MFKHQRYSFSFMLFYLEFDRTLYLGLHYGFRLERVQLMLF